MKLQNTFRAGLTLAAVMLAAAPAHAAPVFVTFVGTWDSTASGNPTGVGGPGMSVGQKFVIRISYDDVSTVTDGVVVFDSFFSPSGNTMRTINLNDAGNSVDIFVPMEGLDAGSPFIYQQDETTHFPAFIPNPTLNFVDGSSISDAANIIGLEFEGNFAGAGNNFIELFNTSPGGGTINMVSQVLNFGTGPAVSVVNTLASASNLIVDAGPAIVYSATNLTRSSSASIVQSNDLGAARADGENFIDVSWSQTGVATGIDIEVGIQNSGLSMTTDTTSWVVDATEQMTLENDSDPVMVSYLNAAPSASASAVANVGGYDFTFFSDDMDLSVNALIADFESLTVTADLDGSATSFFDDLIMNGIQSSTDAMLAAAFGLGAHTLSLNVSDKAGALAVAQASFTVDQAQSVPEPGTLLLLIAGLAGVRLSRRHTTQAAR